ncbi:WxL domain-containing protein [Levilactobacillus tangyuanensis]|uniref:WxL domain-containing protein n=1 Tax=Levilactobacillus tangyuanensis TaxID=2486021 RepID=A0ABW1TKT0_9LACO|nr:WxL domain-containing protein [Levilactobacillus tangyuanensis]
MTRRLKISLLSSLAVLTLGVGLSAALPAAAATTDTSSSTGSSSSSSSASTTQSTKVTSEFDTDPNAAISLDSAPNISFGKNVTPNTKSNGSYAALSADNPVEVSNPGLGSGWSVQLKNTPFTDATGDTLGGAVLSLGAPDIAAGNTGNPSAAPTPGAATKLDGSGTNQIVFSAAAKGGLGVWTADYSLGDINLAVPAGQMGGVYTSTLTWQLSDTPQ